MSHKQAKLQRLIKRLAIEAKLNSDVTDIPHKQRWRMVNFIAQAGLQKVQLAATAPKFPKPRKRKPKAGTGPSWPRTDDQKAQSRPLIVIKPVRARFRFSRTVQIPRHLAKECGCQPKHFLDQL